MRIIAHAPQGIFKGKEVKYDEQQYKVIGSCLEKLPDLKYFSFETPTGEIYMTEEMISQSVFVLEK